MASLTPVIGPGPSEEELDSGLTPPGRTETISDGIFAIVITLLVLNLHVPGTAERQQAGGALQALLAQWPSYLSYLATFLSVAYMWVNHHALFTHVRLVDQKLQWVNLAILLGIGLTPFANALVAAALAGGLSSEAAKVATATYALIFMLATVPWILFWERLARRPELLCPPYTAAWARRERLRGALGVAIYTGGIGVACLSPLLAMGLFLFVALFYVVTARGFALAPHPEGRDA
ncbi:MAG: DUF1211 domain-containing protein [Actinobacteria bacterium]|nr:DUF1211 domain-containing protein [Actinomycetota bacterium]